jgi:hypothetical protein
VPRTCGAGRLGDATIFAHANPLMIRPSAIGARNSYHRAWAPDAPAARAVGAAPSTPPASLGGRARSCAGPLRPRHRRERAPPAHVEACPVPSRGTINASLGDCPGSEEPEHSRQTDELKMSVPQLSSKPITNGDAYCSAEQHAARPRARAQTRDCCRRAQAIDDPGKQNQTRRRERHWTLT